MDGARDNGKGEEALYSHARIRQSRGNESCSMKIVAPWMTISSVRTHSKIPVYDVDVTGKPVSKSDTIIRLIILSFWARNPPSENVRGQVWKSRILQNYKSGDRGDLEKSVQQKPWIVEEWTSNYPCPAMVHLSLHPIERRKTSNRCSRSIVS